MWLIKIRISSHLFSFISITLLLWTVCPCLRCKKYTNMSGAAYEEWPGHPKSKSGSLAAISQPILPLYQMSGHIIQPPPQPAVLPQFRSKMRETTYENEFKLILRLHNLSLPVLYQMFNNNNIREILFGKSANSLTKNSHLNNFKIF